VAELLLEILSEEIPARMQTRAADNLKRLIINSLENDGLKFESLQTFVTPRRLTLVVNGLPVQIEAVEEDRRGPPKAAPEKAVKGFAKANNVSVFDLEIRDTGKGEYYFAVVKQNARQTIDYMPFIVSEVVFNLGLSKSMRWQSTATTWVRPIQSILAIFDGKPLDDVLQLGLKEKIPGLKYAMNNGSAAAPGELEISFSNRTRGHRFLAPNSFRVKGFTDYKAKLRKAHVMLDADERRKAIADQAEKLAKKEKLAVKADDALLAEVAGLVEWPVALMGRIDEAFMELPEEVLTTAMRHHQKYFSVVDAKGDLAPRFIAVANTEAADGGKAIIAGNERVLRARLADARYFWDQDCKRSLKNRVVDLDGMVFHEKLGSVLEKAERMAKLARALAEHTGADADLAERAGRLAKADLTTEMVAEFPELQGVMGRYYALAKNEPAELAGAIADHYAPQGPADRCPSAPVSVAVALADKIDTLVHFWVIDEKPTGSKDPFALRRAALGVIRLIVENGLRVPLIETFDKAWERLQAQQHWEEEEESEGGYSILHGLLDFFADRLKVHLREKGVRHDLISAVFAVELPGGGREDDLVRLLARVEALDAFLGTDDGEHLLVAYKRAANIVRIEEKRDGKEYRDIEPDYFAHEEENTLWQNLLPIQDSLDVSIENELFSESMAALAQLRPPVDEFFDHVTVNTEDRECRANRLALLWSIKVVVDHVADFSKIEG
jgi:glycyl-tRNA synthetase beta chain